MILQKSNTQPTYVLEMLSHIRCLDQILQFLHVGRNLPVTLVTLFPI